MVGIYKNIWRKRINVAFLVLKTCYHIVTSVNSASVNKIMLIEYWLGTKHSFIFHFSIYTTFKGKLIEI